MILPPSLRVEHCIFIVFSVVFGGKADVVCLKGVVDIQQSLMRTMYLVLSQRERALLFKNIIIPLRENVPSSIRQVLCSLGIKSNDKKQGRDQSPRTGCKLNLFAPCKVTTLLETIFTDHKRIMQIIGRET